MPKRTDEYDEVAPDDPRIDAAKQVIDKHRQQLHRMAGHDDDTDCDHNRTGLTGRKRPSQ